MEYATSSRWDMGSFPLARVLALGVCGFKVVQLLLLFRPRSIQAKRASCQAIFDRQGLVGISTLPQTTVHKDRPAVPHQAVWLYTQQSLTSIPLINPSHQSLTITHNLTQGSLRYFEKSTPLQLKTWYAIKGPKQYLPISGPPLTHFKGIETPAYIIGALTAGGGTFGYIKTGSIPSIIAGLTVGTLVRTIS